MSCSETRAAPIFSPQMSDLSCVYHARNTLGNRFLLLSALFCVVYRVVSNKHEQIEIRRNPCERIRMTRHKKSRSKAAQ